MSTNRNEYDASAKLIRVYRAFGSPRTLVPRDELSAWSDVRQSGKDEQGREVKAVRYVFEDEESASYNHQALSFAKIETYLDSGDGERPFDGESPEFSVREDFGIDD